MQPLNIGIDRARQKIRQFCAYSERSQQQVRSKLYSFGLYKHEIEQLISEMIEANYLNEQRYAQQLAGGKFRIKSWGKNKIKQALQQQNISTYNISKAMKEIDNDSYRKTFEQLANKKLVTLKTEKNIFTKKAKLQRYLLQKGFETEMVNTYVNKI